MAEWRRDSRPCLPSPLEENQGTVEGQHFALTSLCSPWDAHSLGTPTLGRLLVACPVQAGTALRGEHGWLCLRSAEVGKNGFRPTPCRKCEKLCVLCRVSRIQRTLQEGRTG